MIPDAVPQIWVSLSGTPLLSLTATLLAYLLADWLYQRSGHNPLCNPVLVSVAVLGVFLTVSGIDYRRYFDGAQFVHFLLGPATVALAVPLYRQMQVLRRSAAAITAAILAGATTAAATAVGLAYWLGASPKTILSLAPKSVTSPIAMGIAEQIGGLPSLTAVLVILTGITGAVVGTFVLDRAGVTNPAARGLAMGTAAHGIGTARAMQVDETSGAFAGLAMGLTGLVTAILLPVAVALWR